MTKRLAPISELERLPTYGSSANNQPKSVAFDDPMTLEEEFWMIVGELQFIYGITGTKTFLRDAATRLRSKRKNSDTPRNRAILKDYERHKNKSRAAREHRVTRQHVDRLVKQDDAHKRLVALVDSFDELKDDPQKTGVHV